MSGLQTIGGRKFVVALSSIASASWLAATGHIEPGIYSVVMVATAGAFLAANVAQKVALKPEAKE